MKKILLVTFLFTLFFTNDALAAEETVKIYPTDDGNVLLYDDDGQTVWSQARNYNGTLVREPITDSDQLVTRADRMSGKYRIYRTSLSFDTSEIPDNSDVIKVIFNGYKGDRNNHGQTLVLTSHSRASSSSLGKSDWQIKNFAHELSESVLLENQYTEFEFNNFGLGYINKEGLTVIGGVQGNDFFDSDIGTTQSGTSIYSMESPGTDKDPYLEITYTVPDEEPELSFGELIDQLDTVVDNQIDQRWVQRVYKVYVKRLQNSGENNPEKTLKTLETLEKRIDRDESKERITGEVANSLKTTIGSLRDLLEKMIDNQTSEKVPLMTQIASPYSPEADDWEHDLLGSGTPDKCGNTIGGCGCAISSLAMVASGFGVTEGIDGTDINPRNLNNWLRENEGYTPNDSVLWGKALEYFSDERGRTKITSLLEYVYDNNLIKDHILANGLAVGFEKRVGHFFTLTDVVEEGFAVRDPLWFETKTTNDVKDTVNNIQNYGGDVNKAMLFNGLRKPEKLAGVIEVHLGSPAELLITDSQGRRVGYDPETDQVVKEIPNSSYEQEEFVLSSEEPADDYHSEKVLIIPNPDDQLYGLQVIGTGEGDYTLTVMSSGGGLNSQVENYFSSTTEDKVDDYVVVVPQDKTKKCYRAAQKIREVADKKEVSHLELAGKLRKLADRIEMRCTASVDSSVANMLDEKHSDEDHHNEDNDDDRRGNGKRGS